MTKLSNTVNLEGTSGPLEKEDVATVPSFQSDHTNFERIKHQVILHTNCYLEDNGYDLIIESYDQRFSDTDMDSLDLMMLAEKISSALDIDMELTALIDYPTVPSLCQYIQTLLNSKYQIQCHQSNPVYKPVEFMTGVGISDVEEKLPRSDLFINSLFTLDSICKIPFTRWDVDSHYFCSIRDQSCESSIRFGGFVENIEAFDSSVWHISSNESKHMDPQQRVLLELVGEMSMGHDISQSGVFIGASTCEYHDLIQRHSRVAQFVSSMSVISTGISILPGRLAFHLGMQGPAVATDTACSSGLVSLSIATELMENSTVVASYCCSSNVLLSSSGFRLFESAHMLAADGRCKVMDSGSDGFSRGEALTAFALEVANNATTQYLCIIRGTSINQDGRSSSLTAPNGPAQSVLLSEALKRSKRDPSEVVQLMLHGTGTPLGDPIELGAALKVYDQGQVSDGDLRLNAVKSSLGHSEAAAGPVSLAVAISMNSGRMVCPILHLRKLNPNIERLFRSFPSIAKKVQVNRELTCSIKQSRDKVVGVSSFASQGTNCHAIIDFDQIVRQPSAIKCIWDKQISWILSRPKSRILFLSTQGLNRTSFQIPATVFKNSNGHVENFLTASMDALEILHPAAEAKAISSLIVSHRDMETTFATTSTFAIILDCSCITLAFNESIGSRSYINGMIESIQTKSLPEQWYRPHVMRGKASLLTFEHFLTSRVDVAVLENGGHTFALAEWRALKHRDVSNGGCYLKTVALVLGSEGPGVSLLHDPYNQIQHSPTIRADGLCFAIDRRISPCRKDGDGFVYELVDTLHSPPNIVTCKKNRLTINDKNFSVRGSVPYDPSLMTLALSILRDCYPACKRHRCVQSGFMRCIPGTSPVSTEQSTFDLILQAMGCTMNKENVAKSYEGYSRDSNGVYVVQALMKIHANPRVKYTSPSIFDGPCIISGGTSGIGLLICGYLKDQIGSLICFSRSGTLNSGSRSCDDVRRSMAHWTMQTASISSAEDVINVTTPATVRARIINAAGTLKDALIRNQSVSNVFNSHNPKVKGSGQLLGCTILEIPLKSFVSFSSIAALMSPSGSSVYASVNCVMESIISTHSNMGIDCSSIQWGAWASIGMVSGSASVAKAMRDMNVSLINPDQGLRAFIQILNLNGTRKHIYSCIPFQNMEEYFLVNKVKDISGGLIQNKGSEAALINNHASWTQEHIMQTVQQRISDLLGVQIDNVSESLIHFGADSLCATEIQSTLSKEFGINLPSTFLFDYPTVSTMTEIISEKMGKIQLKPLDFQIKMEGLAADARSPISIEAIILRRPDGLSKRKSQTPDCTRIVDFNRWDANTFNMNNFNMRFGKFLSDIEFFDAELFNISSREARLMDPQQRLLLEDSIAILDHVSPGPASNIGVLVGMSFWDYSSVAEQHFIDAGSALKLTGRNLSVSSGRISYMHGYNGPSMTIDTACSSSLVCVHVAAKLLAEDDLHSVRIGSAMLSISSEVVGCLASASMTSEHGRSRTLDYQASGYGRGEATAFMSISRTMKGRAIIKCTAVNQDGRSATLTAPNGPSQVNLLHQIYHNSTVSPLQTSLHELHGTGTQLGDPIEVHALATFQSSSRIRNNMSRPLYIASTKTIFGHSEPVAGCVGIGSVVYQMDQRFRDPLLHLTRVSTHVTQAMERSSRRLIPSRMHVPFDRKEDESIASISAFAFQGTNAGIAIDSKKAKADAMKWIERVKGLQRVKHWFVNKVHSWIIPHGYGKRENIWIIDIKSVSMSAMMYHQIFGKALLPGMAVFSIMLNVADLSYSESGDKMVFLNQVVLLEPISLKQDMEIYIRISKNNSNLSAFGRATYRDDEFAKGSCEQGAEYCPQKSFTPTFALARSISGRDIISSSIGNLEWNGLHEKVSLPSIESMDAATHLAACRECDEGVDVSIPVSCELINIQPGKYLRTANKLGTAICDDRDNVARKRNYAIKYCGANISHVHSLVSKQVKSKARNVPIVVSYLSHQEQCTSCAKRSGLEKIQNYQGIPRMDGASFVISCNPEMVSWSISMSFLTQEYIRTQLSSQQAIFILPSTSEKGLIQSQIRVAAKEIGLKSQVGLYNPNGIGVSNLLTTSSIINHDKTTGTFRNIHDPAYMFDYPAVVIGGTSGIGLLFCGWAAKYNHTVAFPVLALGRSGYVRGSSSNYANEEHTVAISSHDCSSVGDNDALTFKLRRLNVSKCSVFNSAGVTEDTYYMTSSVKSYRKTFAPKYAGLKALSSIGLHNLPLMDLLSTSTMSIDIGNIGQANYIAANNAMEIYSKRLYNSGIVCRSVRFGPWRDLGLLLDNENTLKALSRIGLLSMTPLQGLEAVLNFLNSKEECMSIGIMDLKSKLRTWEASFPIRELQKTGNSTDVSPREDSLAPVKSTKSTPTDLELVYNIIQDTLKEVLGVEHVSDDSPFFEIGADSLSLIEIRNTLSIALKMPLPPTILFDYPTLGKLFSALAADNKDEPRIHIQSKVNQKYKDAFISSISQVTPTSECDSFASFCTVLQKETNLQGPIPIDRWDNEAFFSPSTDGDKIYTWFGSFVDNIWKFDAEFFKLRARDARYMDPQCRILLSTTASALNSTLGTTISDRGGRKGVFVGCMFFDYLRLFEDLNHGLDTSIILGNGAPYLSGRLAYTFDLTGTTMGIDTACSSSLVAIHCGRSEILNSQTEFSICCGANAILSPHTSAIICRLGALSRTGRCLSLDSAADGYGRGEAFVSCILSSENSEKSPYLLKATHINQDGRSASMTAPNGPSQETLIKLCISQGNMFVHDVDMISIHGTGTFLGDPLETQALSNIFAGRKYPICILSNKALLGHCEGAAGSTGILNSLYSLKETMLNGIHTLRNLNKFVARSIENGSLYTNRCLIPGPTPDQGGFVAGTSSFGMSGTNAHALAALEEATQCPHYTYLWATAIQLGSIMVTDRYSFKRDINIGCSKFQVAFTEIIAAQLRDHLVFGAFLLPAATVMEIFSAISSKLAKLEQETYLEECVFIKPLRLQQHDLLYLNLNEDSGKIDIDQESYSTVTSANAWIAMINRARKTVRQVKSVRSGVFNQPNITTDRQRASISQIWSKSSNCISAELDSSFHLAALFQVDCCVPAKASSVSISSLLTFGSMQNYWVSCHSLRIRESLHHIERNENQWENLFRVGNLASKLLKRKVDPCDSAVWRAIPHSCIDTLLSSTMYASLYSSNRMPDLDSRKIRLDSMRVFQALQVGSMHFRAKTGTCCEPSYASCLVKTLQRVQQNESGPEYLGETSGLEDSFENVSVIEASKYMRTINKYNACHGVSAAVLTSLGGIGTLIIRYISYQYDTLVLHACSRKAVHNMGNKLSQFNVRITNDDLSFKEDTERLFRGKRSSYVFHTAGVIRDSLISNVKSKDIIASLASKIDIMKNVLHSDTLQTISSIYCFSSIAQHFGSAGQSAYALSNILLDAYSDVANSKGLPSQSVQWGLWTSVGMASALDHTNLKRLATLGFIGLSAEEGLLSLEQIINQRGMWNVSKIMVGKFDLPNLSKFISSRSHLSYISEALSLELPSETAMSPALPFPADTEKIKVKHFDERSIRKAIIDIIKTYVDDSVSAEGSLPVLQMGFDSVSSVELAQSISLELGISLPFTFVYDCPMLDDMVSFIANIKQDQIAAKSPKKSYEPNVKHAPTLQVVSIASKYPSDSRISTSYMPKECTRPVSTWAEGLAFGYFETIASAFRNDDTYVFDNVLFGFSQDISSQIDPNIRWALMLHYEIFSQASVEFSSDTGVFLGWMWSQEFIENTWNMHSSLKNHPSLVTGNSAAFAVGHIAYTFSLSGPCVPVDTACSSSLVALHLSTHAIKNNECNHATITGLNCFLSSATWQKIFSISAASVDGRCKTLDVSADGYGRGEAFATVLISNDAIDDMNTVYVLGTAVKTAPQRSSLTSPHGPSQAKVIRDAMLTSGRKIVRNIALHGTGTSLGDPIELQSLTQTLNETKGSRHEVNLIAPKTLVGHTEGTAGVTNLLACIKSHQDMDGLIFHHLRNINPLAMRDLEGNITLNRQKAPLDSKTSDCSGSSSFGMSGVNSHAILSHAATSSTSFYHLTYKMTKCFGKKGLNMQLLVNMRPFTWIVSPTCKLSWINDHAVMNKTIAPGTLFLLLAKISATHSLGKSEFALSRCSWIRSCTATDAGSIEARLEPNGQISFHSEKNKGDICNVCIEIFSKDNTVRRTENYSFPNLIGKISCNEAVVADLSNESLDQDEGVGQTAHMDAILHLNAIFSPILYIPTALEIFDKGTNSNSLKKTISEVPKFEGQKAYIGSSRGLKTADAQALLSNFQGKMILSDKDQDENIMYNIELQAFDTSVRHGASLSDTFWDCKGETVQIEKTSVQLTNESHFNVFLSHLSIAQTAYGREMRFLSTMGCSLAYPSGQQLGLRYPISEMMAASYHEETRQITKSCTTSVYGQRFHDWNEKHNSLVEGSAGFETKVRRQQHLRDMFPDKLLKIPINTRDVSINGLQGRHKGYYDNLVRVHVTSVALNFRDVLVAMGMYPSSIDRSNIGSDFSGYILDSQIETLQIGDRVFGQSKGVMKEQILVSPELVCQIPPSLTMEEASSIPTVFLTALYCMKCLPNNSTKAILVHSASGGLGLALIQLAQTAGLQVLASAGSPRKRAFLRAQGLQAHHGRSFNFIESINSGGTMAVGAVINTLTSPGMVAASTSLISIGGHFLEVSKRGIYSSQRMFQDRSDVFYSILAIDMMPVTCISNGLRELCGLFAQGTLCPTPGIGYSLSSIQSAALHFKSSQNIGKIICSRADDDHDIKWTWIVTGGLGALGKLTCKLFLSQGNDVVVPARHMGRIYEESSRIGPMIQIISSDINDRDHLLYNMMNQMWASKNLGIVHSSGSIRDTIIPKMTIGTSKEVFASKSSPMMKLLANTLAEKISTVISYSSVSSIWANVGQANYSCANRILDAAAQTSSQQGRNHRVVNWGPWGGMGMAATLDRDILSSRGIFQFDPRHSNDILQTLCSHMRFCFGTTQHIYIQLSKLRAIALAEDDNFSNGKSVHVSQKPDVCSKTTQTESYSNQSQVRDIVRKIVSSLLPKVPQDSSPLMATGLDSLGIIQLVNDLKTEFNQEFSPSFPFDYPSIGAMAEKIYSMTYRDEPPPKQTRLHTLEAQLSHTNSVSINILNSSAMLPLIGQYEDCARPVPFDRWDMEQDGKLGHGKHKYTLRFANFVNNIYQFDNEFFGVSIMEANIMDPQHRCLLQTLGKIKGEYLSQTAISIGIAKLEDPWQVLLSTENLIKEGNGMVSTSRSAGAAAGRLSYTFNYSGPCMSIDTACSSSLVALKTMCSGPHMERSHGFAGGVSLPINNRTSMMLAASSMLSIDGRCKTLDSSANGYGRAEACLVMKLEFLPGSNSILNIDRDIQAKIASTAVNQDGSSSSLTAPYGPSQEALLHMAITQAGISPSQLDITGMHGTGTALGDPIEVNALTRTLAPDSDMMTIVSSKATYGHSETASGLLGLFYNLFMLQTQRLHPIPTLRDLNKYVRVPLETSGNSKRIGRQRQPLIPHTYNSFASVSSFAFQGTNALTVVERYNAQKFGHQAPFVPKSNYCIQYPHGHPLIERIDSSEGQLKVRCSYKHPSLRLSEHRVKNVPVMPASGFLEAMLGIITTVNADYVSPMIHSVTFMRAFILHNVEFVVSWDLSEASINVEPGQSYATRERFCSACIQTYNEEKLSRKMGLVDRSSRSLPVDCQRPKDNSAIVAKIQSERRSTAQKVDSTWHLVATTINQTQRLHLPVSLDAFYCDSKGPVFTSIGDTVATLRLNPVETGHIIQCSSYTLNLKDGTVAAEGLSLMHVADQHSGRKILAAYSLVENQRGGPNIQSQTDVPVLSNLQTYSVVPSIIQALQLWPLDDAFCLGISASNAAKTGQVNIPGVHAYLTAAGKVKEFPHPQPSADIQTLIPAPYNSQQNSPCLSKCMTVYLSGGSGAIGSLVCSWLCAYGSKVIVLSRKSDVSRIESMRKIDQHESLTLQMTNVSASIDADANYCPSQQTGCPIIWFNLSGVLKDQHLRKIDLKTLRFVIAPKNDGTRLMANALAHSNISRVLHFGSIASVLGNESQASYIMANTALNNISRDMLESGRPSSVIHWGPWSLANGMANSKIQEILSRRGIPMIHPVVGLEILSSIMQGVNQPEFIAFEHAQQDTQEKDVSGTKETRHSNARRNRTPTIDRVTNLIRTTIINIVGGTYQSDSSTFTEVGLDSISAVTFSETIQDVLGVHVPSTVMYDYPTTQDLAEHIMAQLMPAHESSQPVDNPVISPQEKSHRVEICSIVSRFPETSGGLTIREAWMNGGEIQTLTPLARWDIERYYSPVQHPLKIYTRFAGWLNSIDMFEGHIFGLLPEESITLDPQARILLELTGDTRCTISLDSSASSFLGVMYNEYLDALLSPTLLADSQASSITGNGMSFLAGRISYHHGISGQAVACDTACSSSLVAVHLGYLSIKEGNNMALAHGINIMITPQTTARICLLNALSPSGRCKTADASADGYGRSEAGCTVCVRHSQHDSTNNIAVLSSGIAQNGKRAGLTAPHGPSQAALIVSAQQRAEQQPGSGAQANISSLHGTGTALGDPIEFSSLQMSRKHYFKNLKPPRKVRTVLMATKSSTGHMEGTAGLCGLVLPLQSSQGKYVSPLAHLRNINRYISSRDFEDLYAARQCAPFVQDDVLGRVTCGSSSFGMSGTNAHLICSDEGQMESDRYIATWRRERYWPIIVAGCIPVRFLLTQQEKSIFSVEIRRTTWLQEHRLRGRPIIPGAVTITLLYHISQAFMNQKRTILQNTVFMKAVIVDNELLTIEVSGRGVSLHKSGELMGFSTIASVELEVALSNMIFCRNKKNKRGTIDLIARIESISAAATANIAKALTDQDSTTLGDSCSLDSSMHLALATKPHDVQITIPVSIQSFAIEERSCNDQYASCLGDLYACKVHTREIDQMIQEIVTKRYHTIEDRERIHGSSGNEPALYYYDEVTSSPGGSIFGQGKATCTIGHEANLAFVADRWHGAFSIGKIISDASSKGKTLEFSFEGEQAGEASLMSMAMAKTISRELTHVQLRVNESSKATIGQISDYKHLSATEKSSSAYRHQTINPTSFALVTGAFGGIGSLASEWLTGESLNIIRIGRHAHKKRAVSEKAIEEVHIQCDVTCHADIEHTFKASRQVKHLHHASGSLRDRLIHHLAIQDVRETTASKSATFGEILGAMIFHGAEKIAAYSSISSIFGNKGQLPYIFANSVINALTVVGQASGVNAISIAWGPWNSIGMTLGLDSRDIEKIGIHSLTPEQGLQLLSTAVQCFSPVNFSPIVIAGWFLRFEDMFLDFSGKRNDKEPSKVLNSVLTYQKEPRDIHALVEEALHQVLGGSTGNHSRDLDSLQSVYVTDRLSSLLGVKLSPTTLYDYPSISDLRKHLIDLVRIEKNAAIITNGVIKNAMLKDNRETPERLHVAQNGMFTLGHDYYCYPKPEHLEAMSDSELSSVQNFIIGKVGSGEIRFLCPVDLRKVDLKHCIVITKRSISIRGEHSENPGEGLNQPALLVFQGASRKVFDSPHKRRRLRSRLIQICQRIGGVLVHIDEIRCEFIIKLDDWLV